MLVLLAKIRLKVKDILLSCPVLYFNFNRSRNLLLKLYFFDLIILRAIILGQTALSKVRRTENINIREFI